MHGQGLGGVLRRVRLERAQAGRAQPQQRGGRGAVGLPAVAAERGDESVDGGGVADLAERPRGGDPRSSDSSRRAATSAGTAAGTPI